MLRYIDHWQLLGYGYWAVYEKESDRLIGTMGIQDQKRNLTPTLAWADSTFAESLCCSVDDDNQPSIRLAERIGFPFRHYVEYHNKTVRMLVRPLPHQ